MSSFQSLVQLSPTKAVLTASPAPSLARSSSALKAGLIRTIYRLPLPKNLNVSGSPLPKRLTTWILLIAHFSFKVLTALAAWSIVTALTVGIVALKKLHEVLRLIVKIAWKRLEKRLYRFRQDFFWHFMCWILNPNALLLLIFWPGWLLILGIWLSW